ncbi:hypothetical protein Tco_0915992, partial [Tanacetum coccineum]
YALTHNPTIYDSLVKQFWRTASVITLADETQEIKATIDSKVYTITEASIRTQLQLADALGIHMMPNDDIISGMRRLGSKSGGWDQFGSNIAVAMICLSTGQVFNFSKLIFDGMLSNMKSRTKFLMYPRFLQMILDVETENKHPYLATSITKKIFANMRRGFQGVPRPLLPAMLVAEQEAEGAEQEIQGGEQAEPKPEPEPDMKHSYSTPSPHQSPQPSHATGSLSVEDLFQLVASQKPGPKGIKRYIRRKVLPGKIKFDEVSTDFEVSIGIDTGVNTGEVNTCGQDVNTGSINVSTASAPVNTGSISVSTASVLVSTGVEAVSTDSTRVSIPSPLRPRREGKAQMTEEDEPTPKKTKLQILQEEASLAEALRLQQFDDEERAKQIHLDSLYAQRLAEEQELSEQQQQRKAQVQFEAQYYSQDNWDIIRAKLEANAELTKSIMRGDLQGEDFASRMVELISERKKKFAEERARAKRNKPMTQSQLRSYMSNFLKNQGTWKLAQLKKFSFDEVKAEFEKLVKQVDEFEPINFKVTKEDLKRFGKELQSKVVKKQKTTHDEAQVPAEEKIEEEKTPKKTGKRVKSIARKVPDEDKEGDYEPLDSRFPIIDWRTVNLGTAPQFDEGKEPDDLYQNMITRSNGSKRFFSNLMTMPSRIDKEDLNAIHRMVMDKYRENEPEGFDRILWSDLRVMYNPSPDDALYPLERSVLSQMLDLELQAKEESETALELIKFIKKQIDEMDLEMTKGDEKDA